MVDAFPGDFYPGEAAPGVSPTGIAIDANSPPLVGGSAVNLQTTNFSPPAGSVLVVCVHADPGRTFTITNTVVSLTWSQIFIATPTGFGTATAWYTVAQSGATNMSITVSGSINNDFAVKAYTVTGADTATPLGASSNGGTTADTAVTISHAINPQVANSMGFLVADQSGTGSGGTTSSATTTWSPYDVAANISGGSGYRLMGAAGGTETFTATTTDPGSLDWAWGVFEIRAAPTVSTTNRITTHITARQRASLW